LRALKMTNESPIRFKHEAESAREFYHPDCPVLYRDHDEIGDLKDCPFPLIHHTFRVVLFGRLKRKPDGTFAVVEYRKSCGHVVWERIPFEEHVEDFDHYGTKYFGADYKIANWERRIEGFRTLLPCTICSHVYHALWIYSRGEADQCTNRKKTLAWIELILEANYLNWREFVDLSKVAEALQDIRYGGGGTVYEDSARWAIAR